jgi:N6-adenosine-specific RNA methylase IME4
MTGTTTIEAIKALDVPSIAANDCVLFLWAIRRMFPEALVVRAAWGFTYRPTPFGSKTRSGSVVGCEACTGF